MKNGFFCVTLVTSRTKIASMTQITAPISELNGGQLQTRLKTFLLQVLDIDIGEIYHIVDASIILGMIKSVSLKFDTYSAPRITEIQSNSDVNNWYWIQTKDNPADLGTREKCAIKDLQPGTLWREGPAWLKNPRESWPIRSDFKKHAVPGLKKEFEILPSVSNLTQLMALFDHAKELNNEESEISVSMVNINETKIQTKMRIPDVTKIMDASKYNCWFKLIHVSSQVLLAILNLRILPLAHLRTKLKLRKLSGSSGYRR